MARAHPSTADRDPLARALRHKAATGAPGGSETTVYAAGDGWRVVDIVCTAGPSDRPFEERQGSTSVSLVLSGSFTQRSDGGSALLSAGSCLLVNAAQPFECAHRHGEGDRCLSFQFAPELFARLAYDAGAARPRFAHPRLPPLRTLAPLTARAMTALTRGDSFEEIAFEWAGAALALTAAPRREAVPAGADTGRITTVLRHLESRIAAPQSLTDLARVAGLSPYHFLRTFKAVTGITPHQWVLRARLRRAAHLLATTREPVTTIALGVGFADLSNFIRTFRAEFGMSPRRYRAAA